MIRFRTLLFGAALAAVCATAFPLGAQTASENARVKKQLEAVLRKRVVRPDGKPISLQVVPTARAGRGEFARVVLKASPARIKDTYVQEISLDARNVKVKLPPLFAAKPKVETERAQTTMRAVISENDLTRALAEGRSTRGMKLIVKFLPGNKMRVTGNLNYTLINGPIEGIGQFKQAPNSKVNLDIQSLKLRGVEVPAWVKNRFANSVNPVIDYQDLPFSPPFKSFKIVGNKAYLSTSK